MPEAVPLVPSLEHYQLRLAAFEGPLDVLLRLIEREQLPVSEISLLAVLDQFIAFTKQLEFAPPSLIAEFVVVAGRLSLLKSRALLPRPPAADADEPFDLVQQLEDYRSLKQAAALLATRHESGFGAYSRGDTILAPAGGQTRLVPQPSSALSRAMRRWLNRAPVMAVPIPMTRSVTLDEMINRILDRLQRSRACAFLGIRASCESPQEVAVAFLALLTLIRRHHVSATQQELFGSIEIVANARRDRVVESAIPKSTTP